MLLNLLLSQSSPLLSNARRALQWWQQKQIDQLHDNAELIRDQILQDLFAIRRVLELAHDNQRPLPTDSLHQLETLHYDLETISNQLSPTLSHGDVSLAIQQTLQQWHRQHPQIALNHQISPNSGMPGFEACIAIMILQEWLSLVAPYLGESASIEVILATQTNQTLLTLRIDEPEQTQRDVIAHLPELTYLCQAFRLFTGISVIQTSQFERLQWQLAWPTEDT